MNSYDSELPEENLEAIEAEMDKVNIPQTKGSTALKHKILSDTETSQAELFTDERGETYISQSGDGSLVIRLKSKESAEWLGRHCWLKYNKTLTPTDMNSVVQILSSKARYEGKSYKLSVRYAFNDSGLWYDIGDGSAVQVTEKGWKIVSNPPILFRRFSHQTTQVTPKSGGDITRLLHYINLEDEDEQLLFLVYVISSIIPGFPHPLLVLHGPQGAGKSTPMRVIKELVDPSAVDGFSPPTNEEMFVQQADHHGFLYYDNLTYVREWLSNALARACTGGSFSKRVLYTDDDDMIYRFQKSIALNGIPQVVSKSDLLDRSILLGLQRIPDSKRKEYSAFWAEFEQDRPYILGAIFDVLVKALAIYPNVELSDLPRMADFMRWGYAIAEAAGYSGRAFELAYKKNISLQNDEAIEASPLAQAIIALMDKRSVEWKGTPSELLKELNHYAEVLELERSQAWPKASNRLGKLLPTVIPNLIARGIHIDRLRGRSRQIVIYKVDKSADVTDALMAKSQETNDVLNRVQRIFGGGELVDDNGVFDDGNDGTSVQKQLF